jgi:toxin ParE1/3/4
MKSRKVVFRPAAEADLIELYDYLSERTGRDRAIAYLGRIELACHSLSEFPERGNLRNDLSPGIRLVGFERRASIAFLVEAGFVRIVRIFYGGRDIEGGWDLDV